MAPVPVIPPTAACSFVGGFSISTALPPTSLAALLLHRNATPQSIRRQMLLWPLTRD